MMVSERLIRDRYICAALVIIMGGVVACKGDKGQSVKNQAQTCFKELERPSAGRLLLSGPVACDQAGPRYRTQGPSDRPREVVFLDGGGRVKMTYRVSYDTQGRPMSEERIMRLDKGSLKVYNRGDRMDFVRPAGSGVSIVRIRTKLDQSGNAVEVAKYAGAELAYRMVRSYRAEELESEATYDGSGKLKFRSEFFTQDNKRMERMTDGQGKVLLERELKSVPQPPNDGGRTRGHH